MGFLDMALCEIDNIVDYEDEIELWKTYGGD